MKFVALFHTQTDGTLPKAAYETLAETVRLSKESGAAFDVVILGTGAATAADSIATCGASAFLTVDDPAVAQPRYASDATAIVALLKMAAADFVLAPATSRFVRAVPGAAARIGAAVDTHIVALTFADGAVTAQRWFYRQRILGTFSRVARPWVVLLDSGVNAPWQGAAGSASSTPVPVTFEPSRTTVNGVKAAVADAQTIRPEAKLLFVAGAGWTKKQKDGTPHVAEAATLIKGFLNKTQASLGSSKSLVDIQSEGGAALSFMSHMNQVGQTGATPRHPKGLSTCCHGEEPHVVGWRFINERRAVNIDANCGWAQGKADVVYVADAFEVMTKVNALLG